jgi:hypothetical protein
MKKLSSILLTLVMVLGMCAISMAQTATPSVDRREHRQQKRIRKGVKSGSLTKREAARLEAQQARTKTAEAAAKADGKVTARERAGLQRRENRTSRRIYRQKHDGQTRHR